MGSKSFSVLLALISCLPVFAENTLGVRGDLHFSLEARGANTDGSLPIYKNAQASIEDRVNDLLPRMTIEEKVAQMYVDYRGLLTRMEYEGVILTYISIQGDLDGWMNLDDPLDDTLTYNQTGLVRTTRYISPPVAHFLLQEQMMAQKSGSIWGGYLTPYGKFVYGVTIGQKYLMENTTLGIPAMFQSKVCLSFARFAQCLHFFLLDRATWIHEQGNHIPSPIGLAASFDTALVSQVSNVVATEAEGLGISQIFAPVLDLSRELRWGRVEENFGEDPFLTGEMGNAYITGLQSGKRKNASSTAIARMAATCKHFAAFGSPQGGL